MDVSGFLGGNFLSQTDLQQPYAVWTIGKVDEQMVGQGQKAEQKICVFFNEHSKALALNKTNLKRIAELYTTNATNWIGKQVLLYRSTTDWAGKITLCLRVCGPQQAPPDPVCDQQGNAVMFQPIAAPAQTQPAPAVQQPIAAPVHAPQQQPVSAPAPQQPQQQQPQAQAATPWEIDDQKFQQQNTPPASN